MAKVTIVPENIELSITDEESILTNALVQKLNLPHSCKSGTCGACKCKVISGEIRLDPYNTSVLTDEEKHQGYTLLCRAHPIGEVTLEIPHALKGFPIKTLPARVEKIDKFNDMAILTLRLPPSQNFGFYAGQYIDILTNGKNRSYSIASSPTSPSTIEVHVRYHKGGVFSEYVWNELKESQILRFKGPLGNFQLSETNLPILMVCTGTGFAPIKSILEYMAANNIKRELHMYWGNRMFADYYMLDLLNNLQQKMGFKLTLCLSADKKDGCVSSWVTQAVENDFNDLSGYEVYACGNLNMIEDLYELASGNLGLIRQNFFSDAFTPSVG
ncbi:MAG: CDP-6-deoxy-delta-3,4-glucoseen reductase [Burkholderiales bacterium]|jgi:CDP-4-dehydro-6-deoxyglucose reductase|nr:CDP-6-deoxy-delta-3,4-glucoseen reductase [Burkholderiales bacterium]